MAHVVFNLRVGLKCNTLLNHFEAQRMLNFARDCIFPSAIEGDFFGFGILFLLI